MRRTLAVATAVFAAGYGIRSAPVTVAAESGIATNLDTLLQNASALSESFDQISDSVAEVIGRQNSLPLTMPARGFLSSEYALERVHPVHKRSVPHHGIDVAAPMGTPVVAPAAGRVSRVVRAGGYGLLVELDHGNGIITRYAHLSRAHVRAGDEVIPGDRLGAVGNSGLSTGPHLHYEIIVHGQAVNPMIYIGANAE